MGGLTFLGRRRREIKSKYIRGRWRARSASLSGMSVSSETRFTCLSHSLTVGSSSRSSMAATLPGSDFSDFSTSRLLLHFHHCKAVPHLCIDDDSRSVQNSTQWGPESATAGAKTAYHLKSSTSLC